MNKSSLEFPKIEYKKLIDILENVVWDRENPANASNYVDNIKKAYEYIRVFPSQSDYIILDDIKEELLRPLTGRETVCCFNCIEELNNNNYANAYHELLDMINDYNRYENKKYISISESFLFMSLLNYFYNHITKK